MVVKEEGACSVMMVVADWSELCCVGFAPEFIFMTELERLSLLRVNES